MQDAVEQGGLPRTRPAGDDKRAALGCFHQRLPLRGAEGDMLFFFKLSDFPGDMRLDHLLGKGAERYQAAGDGPLTHIGVGGKNHFLALDHLACQVLIQDQRAEDGLDQGGLTAKQRRRLLRQLRARQAGVAPGGGCLIQNILQAGPQTPLAGLRKSQRQGDAVGGQKAYAVYIIDQLIRIGADHFFRSVLIPFADLFG